MSVLWLNTYTKKDNLCIACTGEDRNRHARQHAGTGPGAVAPESLLPMGSEIIREEEELKCTEQAQPGCDFSEFAQQPPQAAARGPPPGGPAEAEGLCLKADETPTPAEGGLGSCGQTGCGTPR